MRLMSASVKFPFIWTGNLTLAAGTLELARAPRCP
jgi:hypothetical protein